jgi:hypothetical protein
MGKTAIIFGGLMIGLGIGVYGGLSVSGSESPSITALIPAFFGLPIVLLGVVALRDTYRMHAMHGVAVLALLGLLAPLSRLVMQVVRGGDVAWLPLVSLVLMAVLNGGLLALCVKSFIDARRRRSENA